MKIGKYSYYLLFVIYNYNYRIRTYEQTPTWHWKQKNSISWLCFPQIIFYQLSIIEYININIIIIIRKYTININTPHHFPIESNSRMTDWLTHSLTFFGEPLLEAEAAASFWITWSSNRSWIDRLQASHKLPHCLHSTVAADFLSHLQMIPEELELPEAFSNSRLSSSMLCKP